MLDLLLKHHKSVPRYTSYPTAPYWETIEEINYQEALKHIEGPLSLYFHIPFCRTMCLFCGCSVILNRKEENERLYVDYLKKEITLVTSFLSQNKVTQIHFGGGTPTKLSVPLLTDLMETISSRFQIQNGAEIAIEIDPRTVFEDGGQKLSLLKQLGFNRVSFGVQDTNIEVQKAVKRCQSFEMTKQTFFRAKDLGFKGINIDLIYGLPKQTKETFVKTIDDILFLRPDRIALFSYAKVPWLKEHQKAIPETLLPSLEEKFGIYTHARKAFIEAGYTAIGMDHFALNEDELAIGLRNKTLQRNFQGYAVKHAEESIGFGVTAIGNTGNMYVQNAKDLKEYYDALDKTHLPCRKGKRLNNDDQIRKWTIHTLMCQFSLDKRAFFQKFSIEFDVYYSAISFNELEAEGFIKNSLYRLEITSLGELFIRNIVSHFDAYLSQKPGKFSQSI